MNEPFSLSSVTGAIARQWIVVAVCLVIGIGLGAAAFVLIHPKYTATATVLMVAEPIGASNPKVPVSATKPVLSNDLPSLATDATVLTRLRADLGDDIPIEKLRARIRAKVTFDSGVMPVSYTDKTPGRAVTGANAAADEITRFYREIATTRFEALIGDLSHQLAAAQAQLARYDAQLQKAARLYPYVDVRTSEPSESDAGSSVYQRLIGLRTQRDELASTVAADAAAAAGTRRLIADARPLAVRDIVENDAAYKNVRDQYAKDLAQVQRLQSFGSARYPGLRELAGTVSEESRDVASARVRAARGILGSNPAYAAALDASVKADAQLKSDRAKLSAVDTELEGLHDQIGGGGIAGDVAKIRRERDNAQSAYETLGTRLATAQADRAEAASVGSVVVVDRAQFADVATWTSGKVIAAGVAALTLWLSITLAMLFDARHRRTLRTDNVHPIYGVPVIGRVA